MLVVEIEKKLGEFSLNALFASESGATVLFGGSADGFNGNGETWEWNGTVWAQRVVSGPPARWLHAMAYDAARGVTVLFGGNDFGIYDNDTWELSVPCYPNCDGSTAPPILNVADFTCFLNRFAAGAPYANCDGSTTPPVLNVADFTCFLNAFAAGCS